VYLEEQFFAMAERKKDLTFAALSNDATHQADFLLDF